MIQLWHMTALQSGQNGSCYAESQLGHYLGNDVNLTTKIWTLTQPYRYLGNDVNLKTKQQILTKPNLPCIPNTEDGCCLRTAESVVCA